MKFPHSVSKPIANWGGGREENQIFSPTKTTNFMYGEDFFWRPVSSNASMSKCFSQELSIRAMHLRLESLLRLRFKIYYPPKPGATLGGLLG
jgi:hypothetical protein